jgi:diamine N-acetyltransferase
MRVLAVDESRASELAEVIRGAFVTVAREFGFSEKDAPSNPAFLRTESMLKSMKEGLAMFGAFEGDAMVGCIGIKPLAGGSAFSIERVAVLPEFRHKGRGKLLLDHACREIVSRGGEKASIGIIDENKVLKEWYAAYGFAQTALKKFPHLPFVVCFMEKSLLPEKGRPAEKDGDTSS